MNLATRKYTTRRGWTLLTASLLTAATLAAAGCGESPTTEANKTAAEQADLAARKAASAGDYRATPTLIKAYEGTGLQGNPAVDADIKRASGKEPNVDLAKKYAEQKTIREDLAQANNWLTKATSGEASPSHQAAVTAQLGHNYSASAYMHLANAEDALVGLAEKAALIHSIAERVAELEAQAQRASGGKPGKLPDVAEAEKALTEATAKYQAEKKEADDLAVALEAKRNQARDLYAQAQKDLLKADDIKGEKAIAAYQAAMELRGKADDLMKDVGTAQPDLLRETSQAQLARVAMDQAQGALDAAKATRDASEKRTTAASTEAAAFRKTAQELLEEKKSGLNDLSIAFKNQFDELDTKANQALDDAAKADTQYAQALRHHRSWVAEINKQRESIPEGDPRLKLAADTRSETLIQAMQAAAQYRQGQANLVLADAGNVRNAVAASLDRAYKALGKSGNEPVKNTDQATKYRAAAGDAFKKSLATLNAAKDKSDPSKWLIPSLKALAASGLYSATGQEEARTQAQTAAKEALENNPKLPLRTIAGS